jgi:hypothetical protein
MQPLLPLNPPDDDYESTDSIVKQACEEYLQGYTHSGKNGRFKNLFDLMFEEARENLYIYRERN